MARFYITTAIDYVNARPHLGTAYEKVTADVIARYKRLCGVDTRFLMGNDEHSQHVYRRAREAGLEPLAYCDQMERTFRDVWARLHISYDDFIRTTEPRHRASVSEFVRRSQAAGDIYEGSYEGWYCVSCEGFKQEKDLVDGNCPVHLRPPEWIREKNYFFRLSKYRDPLLRLFHEHPTFLQPDVRRNEILRLLEGGLEDISMSRAGQAWGIPLPFDPSSVVYVWYDALINYVSGLGFPDDRETFERWWPADLHVVGKDITRFHCVVWPAMLLSAGLPVPRQVFGHGWIHFKGQRMSKSLGTVVDPLDAANFLGPDPLRLYLVKEIPYGGDGDFSWERFEERYNVDLANNLGNLVSRLTTMIHRYQGGRVRPTQREPGRLAALVDRTVTLYRASMDRFALHEGVAGAYGLVDAANEFIAETEPWTIAKDPAASDRLNDVLHEALGALRTAAVLLLPVMPSSASEILRRLGGTEPEGGWQIAQAAWETSGDRQIIKGDALWPRLEGVAPDTAARRLDSGNLDQTSEAQPHGLRQSLASLSKKGNTSMDEPTPAEQPAPGEDPAAPAAAPAQPAAPTPAADDRISIDEFMRVDLRVARVLAAERVPKSKKLLKLEVDLGTEQRTLVAGIGDAYAPESLVGRTVVVVANLKPAKLMGIESNGMVLAASPDGGAPVVVGFDAPPPLGSRVR